WTATDDCGLTSTCVQTITIEDTTPPSISCPADLTLECGMSTDPTATGGATGADICGEVNITFSDSFTPACGTTGTITRTWTATDDCGLTSSCDQIITIIDETAPVFDLACQIDAVFTTENGNVCPADVTISLNEGDELTVNDGWTIGGIPILPLSGCVSDNCTADNDLTITVDDITVVDNGTCSRTITVTFLADDGCGNVSDPFVCNYTFLDDTGPEVNFNGILDQGTYVVECDLPSTTWDPLIETADLTITDNCSDIDFAGITVELTQLYDGPCNNNVLTRWQQVWVVPDVCGNETTYTLFTEIIDTTAPDFTSVPDDLTLECDQNIPESDVEAFDSCSEVVYDFVEIRTNGNCPYNYTLTRTWTATDGCGNANTATQVITLEDTTPPEIIFTEGYLSEYSPGDEVFVECSEYGNISLLIANSAAARDNCSGQVPTTYTFEDRGNFDCAEFGYSGHLVSTWTATDECGNTSAVTINWFLVDQSPPEFQGIPADICTDELPPLPNVQAVDDCEFAVLEFNQSEPIDCEGGQYVERSWTATDICGNTATATQRITLSPGNGPTISFDYPGLGDAVDGDLVRVPVDCGVSFEETLAELEAAVSIENSCNSGNTEVELELIGDGDCTIEGYLARYRLSVSATDVCGNTSTFGIMIDLVDETPPVVTSPEEITIECGLEVPTIKATDECGDVASITFMDSTPIEPSCASDPQVFERIWTVTDLCGNSTTFTQLISVIDNTGPVFLDVPADACEDETIDGQVIAIDECTGNEVDVQFSEVMSIEDGCGEVLTRTWTATDACGNTSTTTQQVFYADDVAPSMSFDHPLLFGLTNGAEFFISVGSNLGSPEDPFLFGASAVAVVDNCASNLVAQVSVTSRSSDDCAEDGFLSAYDYVWTGTDPCGNRSEITLTVYYIDKGNPDFFNVPASIEVYCDNVPAPVAPIVSDDYDTDVEVNFNETQISVPEGVLITRIWTAVDDCGNESRGTQKILVVDNTLSAEFVLEPEVVACNSDDNLLSVIASGGNPPYSYEWALSSPLEDGYITSDPTLPNILFTMGFITQTFTVTITDAEGCQLVQSFTVVCDFEDEEGLTSGNNGNSQLNVYPNPTRDHFRVSAGELVEQAVTIRLYNLWGQEVMRTPIAYWPQDGWEVRTTGLPNGTYLLHMEQDGKAPLMREIVILD
ncbi:MAG: T9SS type A sorting domain-containing protein, partial [Bacteroidota bacterium]